MLILCNQKNSNGIIEDETGYWEKYSRFALKYGMHCTAEYYLKKLYENVV
jgi:hypothetical protein